MTRIAGVQLNKNKRVQAALIQIVGVGKSASTRILKQHNINFDKKVKDLNENEISRIRESIDQMPTEGELRRKVSLDIKRLQEIGSYRGYRHRRKLPVRGQTTRYNARTKRGAKKTIANKKKETK